MDKNNNKSYSTLFYGLVGAGVVGALGGLYYLYTILKGEPELTEDQNLQIEEIKQEIEDSKGELTPNLAIQIMAMTNKVSEEILKKLNPDINERRRAAIKNQAEYERLCVEYLEAKNHAYIAANNNVMNKFGFNETDFQNVLQRVNPIEFEQKVFQYEKPNFENNIIPDKSVVKEAFIYYSNKFIEDMKEFRTMISQFYGDPAQQEMAFSRLLIVKLKVDDELFLKFNLTEHQIRYLLYEYNLLDDPEIRQMQNKLGKFEELLGLGGGM